MSGPLGQFVLVLSLSFLFCSNTHIHAHFPRLLPLLSLSPSILYLFWFPSFIFWSPSFHLLFLIPASGHPLTAMMTSFSGLRELSLLASLNGSLWWPRYGSQSLQCTACEAVFNMTISLTGPQVVDWIRGFASYFFPHSHIRPYFFWSPPRLIYFSFLCFVFSSWFLPILSLSLLLGLCNASISLTRP